ncbi:MAG: formate--tetrahydrofolate ligase, partial [Bacilli bacterium]|nr:formate--tetrahydrofolate ligase [Bacilli bacterium]
GNLALIHCGPFANIAHGCNSIIATETAMKLSEYTVTEAGFGADLGAEKFLDLKCRKLKRMPNVVVLVATVRALKMHGGIAKEELTKENVWALKKGAENLIKHIENMTKIFGLPVVVAINKFSSDTEQEIKAIKEIVAAQKVKAIVVDVWSKGGQGALELADEVIKACEEKVVTSFAYELTDKPEIKIAKIATKIYGAKTIKYSKEAEETLQEIVTRNLNELPVIIAKTQYSLSDNPKLLGVPKEHELTIRSIEIRTGAKMIVAIAGDMLLMPGLGKEPAAEKMYIDDDGNISGLF